MKSTGMRRGKSGILVRPLRAVMPALLSLACTAHAGLLTDYQASAATHVTQLGFQPSDINVPRGQGHDVAIASVLPLIVPHEFSIDIGNVEPSLAVTWSGDLPWDVVLAKALGPLDSVRATIDWNRHTVSLRSLALAGFSDEKATAPVAAPGAVSVAALAPVPVDAPNALPTEHAASISVASAPVAAVPALPAMTATTPPAVAIAPLPAAGISTTAPSAAPAAPDTWTLHQGALIGQELKRWGALVDWHVTWYLQHDVSVPTTTTFTGDFPSAVTQVFDTLAENGAQLRVRIFDGNRTVIVTGAGVGTQ